MQKELKKAKKLTLAKETLRLLDAQETRKAAGGVAFTVYTCFNTCYRSCRTCDCP